MSKSNKIPVRWSLIPPQKQEKQAEPVSFHRYMDATSMPPLRFTNFTGSYSYLGPDHANLGQHAANFCLDSAGVTGDVQALFAAFLDHVRSEHLTAMHTDLWLSVRVSAPCNTFDSAHWHQDEPYFSTPRDQPAFKIATVFSGPSTMFLKSPDAPEESCAWTESVIGRFIQNEALYACTDTWNFHRVVYRDYIAEQPWWHERPDLEEADYIDRLTRVVNAHWTRTRDYIQHMIREVGIRVPARGEAARWVIGDGMRGGVHSEPAFTTHRLFVSVVPGTERQIRRLCGLWGEEYGKSYEPDFGGDLQAEYAQVSMTYPLGLTQTQSEHARELR